MNNINHEQEILNSASSIPTPIVTITNIEYFGLKVVIMGNLTYMRNNINIHTQPIRLEYNLPNEVLTEMIPTFQAIHNSNREIGSNDTTHIYIPHNPSNTGNIEDNEFALPNLIRYNDYMRLINEDNNIIQIPEQKIDIEIYKEENPKIVNSCIGCFQNYPNFTNDPCGHIIFCGICAPKLLNNKCPICNVKVDKYLQIFIN